MQRLIATTLTTFAIGGLPFAALAQDVSVGKMEYEANCAVCHGKNGRGEGPLAEHLAIAVPDITRLSARHDGVFPFKWVYRMIDGREEVAAHGTRDMPVWGKAYSREASDYFMDYRMPYDPEAYVTGRIVALTGYIYELQNSE
jgi:hypothetical protein